MRISLPKFNHFFLVHIHISGEAFYVKLLKDKLTVIFYTPFLGPKNPTVSKSANSAYNLEILHDIWSFDSRENQYIRCHQMSLRF